MQFYNKSSDALYSFSGQTDSGSDGINQTWAANFTVTNDQDSTNYNYREIYLSGNQHLYFNNGANQAYLHLDGSWQNASDIAYKKDIEEKDYPIFNDLVGYAIKYFNDVIKKTKKYKKPNKNEKIALESLIEALNDCGDDMKPEDIQTKIYSVGKENGYKD